VQEQYGRSALGLEARFEDMDVEAIDAGQDSGTDAGWEDG
jgi:hypothetical protein